MFFELEGKKLVVKFRYEGTTTIAKLYVQKGGDLDFTGFVGIATLYHTDIFVKKVGRKIALRKLLDGMAKDERYTLGKEIRRSIWNKYFEKHRK